MTVRPTKSDQPGHPPSLIRVFAVRMKKPWVLSYPLSVQQRLWSDWVDAQPDLSHGWAHSHCVGFAINKFLLNLVCFLNVIFLYYTSFILLPSFTTIISHLNAIAQFFRNFCFGTIGYKLAWWPMLSNTVPLAASHDHFLNVYLRISSSAEQKAVIFDIYKKGIIYLTVNDLGS